MHGDVQDTGHSSSHAQLEEQRFRKDQAVECVAMCGIPYIQFPQSRAGNQPIRLNLHALLFFLFLDVRLSGLIVVSTLVFQKSGLFSCKVDAECDSRDAEAGE
jgi:hypothetical protein